MGVQGYSGKAAATARAPASLVHWDKPTKNSLPGKHEISYIEVSINTNSCIIDIFFIITISKYYMKISDFFL